VLSHPGTQLLVLGMTTIPQRLKQMRITTNAAAILWRTGTCTIQAAWNNYILGQGLDVFYSNHVPPTIPKIIFVDKASPFLTGDCSESYTSIILHPVAILWIWFSIVHGADDELVQMRVFPAHDNLEHLMQGKERYLAGNHKASPDWWFNVGKLNMQLIDNIG